MEDVLLREEPVEKVGKSSLAEQSPRPPDCLPVLLPRMKVRVEENDLEMFAVKQAVADLTGKDAQHPAAADERRYGEAGSDEQEVTGGHEKTEEKGEADEHLGRKF